MPGVGALGGWVFGGSEGAGRLGVAHRTRAASALLPPRFFYTDHHRTTAPPHHRTTAPPHHRTTAPPHHRPSSPLPNSSSCRTPLSLGRESTSELRCHNETLTAFACCTSTLLQHLHINHPLHPPSSSPLAPTPTHITYPSPPPPPHPPPTPTPNPTPTPQDHALPALPAPHPRLQPQHAPRGVRPGCRPAAAGAAVPRAPLCSHAGVV